MTVAEISVHRLRLVAGRGGGGHALRARVEDALRISSKPPALAHRFVLLRRLRLRLPREASAQSLALQLEQQWRTLEALAEPIARAPAEAAAVWAADEASARLALLQRWLATADCEAWFWQRLLPAAATTLPLPQRLAVLLFEPLQAGGESAAAVEPALQRQLWREALPRIDAAGLWPALLAVLQPRQLEALRAAPRLLRVPAGPQPAAPGRPFQAVVPGALAICPTSLEPLDSAQAEARARPAHGAATTRSETTAGKPNLAAPPEGSEHWQRPRPAPPNRAPAARADTPASSVPSAQTVLQQAQSLPADAPAAVDGMATEWAGLWFLLPMLQQRGLARQPQPARLFASLLRMVALRHGMDATAWQWVEQVSQFASVVASASLQPTEDAQTQAELLTRTKLWHRSARLGCVQKARLPLRRLLQRPGRVWLAPHRIDLALPLRRADIRIRRAGFDIDPGYLPWLDCVIRFHYL